MVYSEVRFGDFQAARREATRMLSEPRKGQRLLGFDMSTVLLAASHILLTEPHISMPQIKGLTGLDQKNTSVILRKLTEGYGLFTRTPGAESPPDSRARRDIFVATEFGKEVMKKFQERRELPE